ncbi:hypothetical protein HMPREF3069_20430 [Achromobacter xylosoxidans]|uniref:hypothetical protein n=1 Tax=Alcaligenes xylosoxydans xylosoxydans TaxID=85698 RepID=UPI0006C8AD4B|nr:hypothetical protein [Achromobacter xylosoxidans]MCH1993530.1 hypothetical protein [Achromobacter xylosoxidans]OFL32101.1 hypothetical protein HMPREF2772_01185 [Achromobacter xylosoxidans]OFS40727.1 hypothetical protein HMPREF3069_20430 [Achromobacter xylosoxidans]
MSVFADKAAALQREADAARSREEQEKAALESKLKVLEVDAAAFLQKLAELLDEERAGAPKLGFIASLTKVRDAVPVARIGLNLSFERNPAINGQKAFIFRVLVNDDRKVTTTLLQRIGSSGPATIIDKTDDLGPFDHADIVPRVNAAFSKALDRALVL